MSYNSTSVRFTSYIYCVQSVGQSPMFQEDMEGTCERQGLDTMRVHCIDCMKSLMIGNKTLFIASSNNVAPPIVVHSDLCQYLAIIKVIVL